MKNSTIVVVEDDYYIRKALIKYITDFGDPYTIVGEADNGQKGLEIITNLKPDIAIVDITMPIMDGLSMVKEVYSKGFPTSVIILTGYSEFTYAQTALQLGVKDYLLKPLKLSDFKKSLDKVRNASLQLQNERQVFNGFLSTSLAEQLANMEIVSEDLTILSEYLNYPLYKSGYFLVLSVQYLIEKTKLDYSSEIIDAISNSLTLIDIHSIAFIAQPQTICFILNYASPISRADFIASISSTCTHISNTTNTLFKIAISEEFQNAEIIHQAYTEVCAIQFLHMFHSTALEIYFAEDNSDNTQVVFSLEQQHSFRNLLINGTIEELSAFIHSFFSYIENQRCSTYSTYFFVAEVISMLGEYSGQIISIEDLVPIGLSVPSLLASKQVRYLEEHLIFLVRSTVNSFRNNNAHSKLIGNVQKYIEQHYYDPTLRLADIAKSNYISLQYLCTVFRKEVGQTIGEYLSDIRINHAKELLREEGLPLAVVAEKCGYEDSGYFSKCFKKKLGVSPKQYSQLSD